MSTMMMMMTSTKAIFVVCAVVLVELSNGQDCIDYGKKCADSGQCCGGCCINGVCIDTYRSCHDLRNPCLDHYCPGGMECFIFKEENCPECDLQPICTENFK